MKNQHLCSHKTCERSKNGFRDRFDLKRHMENESHANFGAQKYKKKRDREACDS